MSVTDETHARTHRVVERTFREIFQTIQWLLIALILALFFRAFIMEAYRIPTGSMAATLKGAHFRLYCRQCGCGFDRGFDSSDYGLPKDSLPESGKEIPNDCRCPGCGCYLNFDEPIWVANGDRILVLKCQYQFVEPKRWDVIVFKDPSDPANNVIKRLVGRPGETVEIVDGDIYIDGRIASKPDKLQQKLWVSVCNNDYRPREIGDAQSFRSRPWRLPWKFDDAAWRVDAANITCFESLREAGDFCELIYSGAAVNGLRADYAYNGAAYQNARPYCSDLQVRFFARSPGSLCVGAELSKYGRIWRGWVKDGTMFIGRVVEGNLEPLAEKPMRRNQCSGAMIVFENVDHRLALRCGPDSVTYELGKGPDGAGQIRNDLVPGIKILAMDKVRISHLAVFRDIYYTVQHFVGDDGLARAAQDNAFTLDADEFFVLGDNSPDSYDGRWWDKSGIGNNGISYRAGIVPRDYLVGKAVFVYWPGGLRFFPKSRQAIVPNIGQIRFIYGGSEPGR